MLFIDFESSGLERGSFPIEVAWAGEDMQIASYIIRPTEVWLSDPRLWDPAAERLHGLSREKILDQGRSVEFVAERLLQAWEGKKVYSNAPLYDQDWLHRLLCAAQCDSSLIVEDFNELLASFTDIECITRAYHQANKIAPATHRASEDVLNLWEIYRQCQSCALLERQSNGAHRRYTS